jgi:hypothetical protein
MKQQSIFTTVETAMYQAKVLYSTVYLTYIIRCKIDTNVPGLPRRPPSAKTPQTLS